MSYTGPEFDPPQQRRFRRAPLAVGLAALVPGALLGWVVYEGVGRPGGDDAGQASAATPKSAPASPDDDAKAPVPTPSGSLAGKVILIDPGHNPGNFQHASEINQKVNIGTNWKECDTTGTSTNAGYSEARFTLDVAHRLRALLEKQGATVKMTHDGDRPAWGPCVDKRAAIGNDAHADAAISIHADGAPEGDRGFHVILPATVHSGAADTRPIVGPSRTLGERVEKDFAKVTGSAPSNYVGNGTGLDVRKDLGGLNLSTVPKVFIECGNMRDSKDAALLTSGAWRQKAAQGISDGLADFLSN
ncbi:N-acetylmuramoyl-L-alanine amidase [Streptomyces sp. Ag109_O5-1]|uniref:N-acetylmuramoyl-L-alanine amidase n=1 Tax=Streptomyces sp. Ag109_O5-1 TaxID=1938851 RepID=UPI000F4E2C64|nr:N-acetylmuramoyl-L-alanine amidase [Streptomyces sp. Ag109_O5-1]RPE44361.1 N-acetylmuramoyl-L-alanine amidase [Streptomyces sp. Ag109_O5-1]